MVGRRRQLISHARASDVMIVAPDLRPNVGDCQVGFDCRASTIWRHCDVLMTSVRQVPVRLYAPRVVVMVLVSKQSSIVVLYAAAVNACTLYCSFWLPERTWRLTVVWTLSLSPVMHTNASTLRKGFSSVLEAIADIGMIVRNCGFYTPSQSGAVGDWQH